GGEGKEKGGDRAVDALAALRRPGLAGRHQESPSYSGSTSGWTGDHRRSASSSSPNLSQSAAPSAGPHASLRRCARPGPSSGGNGSSTSSDQAVGCSADCP